MAFSEDWLAFSLLKAFRQLGIETEITGYHNIGSFNVSKTYDSKLLRNVCLYSKLHPVMHDFELNRVKKVINNFKPDYILTCFFHKDITKLIQNTNTKFIFWETDYPYGFGLEPKLPEGYNEFLTKTDVIFTTVRDIVQEHRKLGLNTFYLPLAIDPEVFHPVFIERKLFITFTGSYYPKRESGLDHMLYPLIKAFGCNVHIFGKEWRDSSATLWGIVDYRKLKTIYSASRFVLNVHHEDVAKQGGINFRMFEALACGAFLITDKVSHLEEMFDIGKELVVVEENDDIVSVIFDYEADIQSRIKIANAGYDKVIKNHTIFHRAENILEVLSHG